MLLHKLHIEMLTKDIVTIIARLHSDSWLNTYRGILADTYLDGNLETERLRYWQQRVKALQAMQDQGEIFLVQVGKQPAGFLCIEIGPEAEWGAYVDNLHVLPHWQGQGIGAQLLKCGAEWAKDRGAKQMYLWVLEKNADARHFYAREGWREAEHQRHEMPDSQAHAAIRLIYRI